MKRLLLGAVIVLGLAPAAQAAAPAYGTREGDLACAGLVKIAFAGASVSQNADAKTVAAMAAAWSYHLGRLSQSAPEATDKDIAEATGRLTLEEKNAFASVCLHKAGDAMTAHAGG